MKLFWHGAALLLSAVLSSGCATLIQKSGELLSGEAFTEQTTNVYRSVNESAAEIREVLLESGGEELVITSAAYPGLELRAVRGTGNAIVFTRLHFISAHVRGWNEFTLELDGRGTFTGIDYIEKGRRRTLRITSPLTGLVISSGSIRLKETWLTGDQALERLRNRRERIVAITEWMASRSVEPGSGETGKKQFASIEEFEAYWKPVLLPELVPEGQRPSEYQTENAEWASGNGINWNKHYTATLFPEELRVLRDSGTLLRDWEESLSWIFLEYSMDFIAAFYNGMEFHRN